MPTLDQRLATWRANLEAQTITLSGRVDAEVARANTAITAMQGGGPAWDNATPAFRTQFALGTAQDLKALMLDFKLLVQFLQDGPPL
jgi:hypothetical protein